MSIKWAIGAIVAVMAAMVMLPGIASAHNSDLDGSASCKDVEGGFIVSWTLTLSDGGNLTAAAFSNASGSLQQDGIDVFSGGEPTPGTTGNIFDGPLTTGVFNEDTVYATTPNGFDFEGDPEPDGVHAEGEIHWSDQVENDVSANVPFPDYCIETGCVSGDFTEQPVNDFTDNDSCDTLLRCDEGQSLTVTQHELDTVADLADSTAGDCPTNEPITPVVLVVEPEPEVVEPEAEVESAVVEVAAALPAAGYGDSAGASFAWTALAAVALLSIGGGVAVVARRK
jgi:hypothetical protein